MIGYDLDVAKAFLQEGKTVAIPTETVYGLAANALDKEAVLSIFQIKNRPHFDPLILHTHAISEFEKYVTHVPKPLQLLAEAFSPGPITLLLPKKNIIPDIVTSGLVNVAIRIPNHPLTLELLRNIDFPLAAPSANPFGYVSPTTAEHVNKQLGTQIPYILDGGACNIGLESTIVGMEEDQIVVYRLGGLSIEAIEELVGTVKVQLNQSSNPAAPGMLKSHYAPRLPLIITNIQEYIQAYPQQKIGIISFMHDYTNEYANCFRLSVDGNLNEAAQNLFTALRHFDDTDGEVIITEKLPDSFLGRAINDRLTRAAAH
jgi:L-threonylcarbamoyladenylate synthase